MSENHLISFGKYRGQKIGSIPVKYLDWLAGQGWFGFKYPADARVIKDYLKLPYVQRELEAELGQEEEERNARSSKRQPFKNCLGRI